MDVPLSIEEITPDWLTAAMGEHLGGGTIARVEAHDIGTGTGIFGQIARLVLGYRDAEATGPESVVVKLPCTEPENLAVAMALGIYEREVRFYDTIAPRTPLRVPTCYHAQLAGDGRSVLVLEDLSGRYQVGDQVVGATLAQAEAVVDALAELHATWWEREELQQLAWLPDPDAPAYVATVPEIYRRGLPVLESDWADRVPAAGIDAANRLAPRFVELMHRTADAPRTFGHCDTRLDNVFFERDGDGVACIDFQLVLRARGVTDIAYFLGTSVPRELARGSWESLLRRWHTRICDLGVTGYGWDECLRQYRECALYYLCGAMSLIASFDTGNARGDAMATAYTTRVVTHVVDTDAVSVL